LSEKEQSSRNIVITGDITMDKGSGIPDILAQAGYTIKPSQRDNAHGR
jgi:hypothetical protein